MAGPHPMVLAMSVSPFHRMRLAATLLLFAMAVLFIAMLLLEGAHPALPWVKAFAEAALVGGLADWFAVTALFRHPLGLPIPHTAIIPANKARIGTSLARFLKENFLTPAVVARRLEDVDLAGLGANWLMAAGRSDSTSGLKDGWGPLLAQLVRLLDEPRVGDLVKAGAADRLRALDVAPLVADAVEVALARRRQEPVLDAAIAWALRVLEDEQSSIRAMVSERTNWLLRVVNVDEKVSTQLISGVRSLLLEVAADPQHPLRARLADGLADWAHALRTDPAARAPIEAMKNDLIDNPALAGWIGGLWEGLRAGLMRRLESGGTGGDSRLAGALAAVGARIEADAALRRVLNRQLRRLGVGMVNRYGDAMVRLVSDTLAGWDASMVTDKLEAAVGRDLQFIRINGTLIGGCIGMGIHAAQTLIAG